MSERRLPQIVPVDCAGKWLAWTEDALRIAGVGDTPQEAKAAAARAGVTVTVIEWVPPADERFVGNIA
jgi:hypothetical protein